MRRPSKQQRATHTVSTAAVAFLAACGFTAPYGALWNGASLRTRTGGAGAGMQAASVPSVVTREVPPPAAAARPPSVQGTVLSADGDTSKPHLRALRPKGRLTALPQRREQFREAQDNLDLMLARQIARQEASKSGALQALARVHSPAFDSVLGTSIFGRDAAHVLGSLRAVAAEDPYGPGSVGQVRASSGGGRASDDSIAMSRFPGRAGGTSGSEYGRRVGALPAKRTVEGPGGDGDPASASRLARHGTSPPGRS